MMFLTWLMQRRFDDLGNNAGNGVKPWVRRTRVLVPGVLCTNGTFSLVTCCLAPGGPNTDAEVRARSVPLVLSNLIWLCPAGLNVGLQCEIGNSQRLTGDERWLIILSKTFTRYLCTEPS